jgi:hypothetical protein
MRWDDGWDGPWGGDREDWEGRPSSPGPCCDRDPCACGSRGLGFRPRRRREVRRGDTLQFQVLVGQDSRTLAYGTVWSGERWPPNTAPSDLSAWTRIVFTAKRELPDWDNQSVWQLDDLSLGGVASTGTGGAVSVTGPAWNTTGLGDGPVGLVYDLKGVDAAGLVHTLESGEIVVLPDVTRIA